MKFLVSVVDAGDEPITEDDEGFIVKTLLMASARFGRRITGCTVVPIPPNVFDPYPDRRKATFDETVAYLGLEWPEGSTCWLSWAQQGYSGCFDLKRTLNSLEVPEGNHGFVLHGKLVRPASEYPADPAPAHEYEPLHPLWKAPKSARPWLKWNDLIPKMHPLQVVVWAVEAAFAAYGLWMLVKTLAS